MCECVEKTSKSKQTYIVQIWVIGLGLWARARVRVRARARARVRVGATEQYYGHDLYRTGLATWHGWLSVTPVSCLVEGLYILHNGKLTAVGGRFLYARHLENVVF